eukprot:609118-Pleurochrysis_carterae.AAC.3
MDTPVLQPTNQPAETRPSPTIETPLEPVPAIIVPPPPAALPTQPTPTIEHGEQQVDEARRACKRTLGPYPLRSQGAALLTLRARNNKPRWGRSTGCAFAASAASTDPGRTRKQAMAEDRVG